MKFGFVVFPDVQLMDVVGPLEVINMWQKIDPSVEVVHIAENKNTIDCGSGFSLKVDYTFNEAPHLDYVCVPGGMGRLVQTANPKILDFIRQQYLSCRVMLAVCTGSFILYHAGVLKGHNFTTYWRAIPELIKAEGKSIVQQRVVKSGKIWTSGGVSSGIDLIFELISDIAGEDVAGKVQLLFEYFPPKKFYGSLNDMLGLPLYPTEKPGQERFLPEYIMEYVTQA